MEKTFQIVGNDISDGFYTFDDLHEHRRLLFINLCLAYPQKAYWRRDLYYKGWIRIGLELNTGQVSYHVPKKYLPLFKGKIRDDAPEWDGHTCSDVVLRLLKAAEMSP